YGGGNETVREDMASEIVPVGFGPSDSVFEQRDRVKVPPDTVLDVYYPIPYYSRPNLRIHDGEGRVKIVQQSRDHFRVKNDGLFERDILWEAKGVKPVPAPVVQVAAPTNTDLPPLKQLPVEPVPVKPQP